MSTFKTAGNNMYCYYTFDTTINTAFNTVVIWNDSYLFCFSDTEYGKFNYLIPKACYEFLGHILTGFPWDRHLRYIYQ